MRAALVIAARVLRQRLRDRSAIIFAVLTPLGLALAFSMLIPNEFSTFRTRFIVIDRDGGAVASVLTNDVLGGLRTAGVVETTAMTDEAAATAALRDGTAGAAIVIPAGLTDAVAAGKPAQIRILGGEFAVSIELARSAVSQFASRVGAVQLMVATTSVLGGAPDAATVAAARAAVGEPGPITVLATDVARAQANLATFYGAAMAIMFVFFATQYGALALLADRQIGTMNRLLAAPISAASIVFGASLAGFVLGLVSMAVLAVATTALQGANWGAPALLIPLVVAAVISAMGISTLVASIARTAQQANGLNAIVAFSLAAVGGVLIPASQAPEALARIAQVTPHFWFLRAIDTLSNPSATLADIAPSIGILVAIGLVTGTIGLLRARAALVPR